MLDILLGLRANARGGCPGRRPFGIVMRDGAQHVRVGHQAPGRQPAAQRLGQFGRSGQRVRHASAPAIWAAAALAPARVMIELA